jgi:hypothetical protein
MLNCFNLAGRRFYIPRRSRHVPYSEWQTISGTLKSVWDERAREKGFRIHCRIRDSNHIALDCLICGALTAHKLYTLQTAQPACGGCQEDTRRAKAKAAGLILLRRDENNRHYGIYRAPCGHEIRRQFNFIDRIIAGETSFRCEICLIKREEEEADKHDWSRIGTDPAGNANYRLYMHSCGHTQRIGRANMYWGQVDCANCGETWASKSSSIYLVDLTDLCPKRNFIKLGYSGGVDKRLRYQLGLPDRAIVKVLRIVKMPTGNAACAAETKAHGILRHRFSTAVVPPGEYEGFINVLSEIYRPWLRPHIDELLDQIEAGTFI